MSTDVLKHSRRRPLAAGLSAILMLSAPFAVAATTWTVNICDDASVGTGTTGSLRYAATNAVSGDAIDMTGLACGTITLSTGAVVFGQDDITVNGPGKSALTINGSDDRVFRHDGHGAFALNDLTVANGYDHPPFEVTAAGGCIRSNGKVNVSHAAVRSCTAKSVGAAVRGGGIYAATGVIAKYSDITGNTATSSGTNANGGGGGIFTYGYVLLGGSTLGGNSAQTGAGGGVRAFGDALVIASTISGNTAARGGGIYARGYPGNDKAFTLINSTVSGNLGLGVVGGAMTNAGTIHVYNSTVAFNTAGSATGYGSRHYSSGLNVDDSGAFYHSSTDYQFKVVSLQSSIFSNNVSGISTTTDDDFGITRFSNLNLVPVGGQNNLVFAASYNTTLPAATVTLGVCPQLGPLLDNGGPTRTHALVGNSPAIDAGNTSGSGLSVFDQRGSPFARVSGAAADVGAYEVQQGDIVFSDGFDGPPTCSGG